MASEHIPRGPLGLDAEKIAAKVEKGADERYKNLNEGDREAAKSVDLIECFLCESQRLLLAKLRVPEVMICPGEFDCSLCHPSSNACPCETKSRTTFVDLGQFHLSKACLSPQSPYPIVPYINPTVKTSPNDPPIGYISVCGCPIHISVCYLCAVCRAKSDWKDEDKGTVRVRHRALPR